MAEHISTSSPPEKKTSEQLRAERNERSRAYRKTEAGRAARRVERKRRKERHPEKVREEWRRQRERHRSKRLAYMREYNKKHRERLCRQAIEARNRDIENRRAKSREWFKQHPGYDREWCRLNPDKARAISVKKTGKRRAAKKRAALGTDRKACLARIREIKSPELLPCHWCGIETTKDKRHVDHVIPLSRDGPHCAENLVPACQSCNCRKRNKLPEEFLATR